MYTFIEFSLREFNAGSFPWGLSFMLGAMSIAGPGGFWDTVWANALTRTVYVALVFALFVWVFVAAGWALVTQLQRPVRAAAGG